MRIYISGPITGMSDYNYPAFHAAAKRLRDKGHWVINPAELSALFGTADELDLSFSARRRIEENLTDYKTYEERSWDEHRSLLARAVMDADLAAVRSCDAIYLLRGWEQSRGARKELAEALAHGLSVVQDGDANSVMLPDGSIV